jgi:hypothetical protein
MTLYFSKSPHIVIRENDLNAILKSLISLTLGIPPKPIFQPLCISFTDTDSIHIQYTLSHTPLLIHFIEISEVLIDGTQISTTTTHRNAHKQISCRQISRRSSIVETAQSKEKMFPPPPGGVELESVIGLGLELELELELE